MDVVNKYGGLSERFMELVLKTSDRRKSAQGSNPWPSAKSYKDKFLDDWGDDLYEQIV